MDENNAGSPGSSVSPFDSDWLNIVVAKFAEKGISKKTLFAEYLWIEVPAVLKRWEREELKRELLRHSLATLPHWEDRSKAKMFIENLNERAYGKSTTKRDDQELDKAALASIPQFG